MKFTLIAYHPGSGSWPGKPTVGIEVNSIELVPQYATFKLPLPDDFYTSVQVEDPD